MELTLSTPLKPFAEALGNAALQSSIEALGERSHAGALGSLEHLIYSICQQHPKALAVVNEYVERHSTGLCSLTSATAAGVPVVDLPGEESSSGVVRRAPLLKFRQEAAELDEKMHQAGKQLLEEWFKPLAAAATPPADTATMSAAEHEELRALREQLEEKQRNYWELEHQAREIRRTLQTTSQTAGDADATAAVAAPEAPAPQPPQTAPCGAPTSDAGTAPSVPPVPASTPSGATAQSMPQDAPPQTGDAALTPPAPEPAPHAPPSPASSARPNTTEAGESHASTQPSQPTTAAS